METTFKGQIVTRQAILDAMRKFPAECPNPEAHENWQQKGNFKYAVRYGGRVYPPKCILSMAAGIPVTDFNGGEQTNRVFRQLGFDVEDK